MDTWRPSTVRGPTKGRSAKSHISERALFRRFVIERGLVATDILNHDPVVSTKKAESIAFRQPIGRSRNEKHSGPRPIQ